MAQTHAIDIDAALKAEQEKLNSRKKELETELAEINGKLGRINRYFSEEPQQDPFKLTPSLPSRDRRERGYVQDKVKATIYSHPDGITSGELTRALDGISGQSIQNALSALRKGNQIVRDGARGGKYRPITLGPTPSTEAEAPTVE